MRTNSAIAAIAMASILTPSDFAPSRPERNNGKRQPKRVYKQCAGSLGISDMSDKTKRKIKAQKRRF